MKFMKLFSVLAIAGYIIFSSSVAAAQPNILFIVSDDHGWGDLPSNWDNTEVRLPTLEDLAAQGVRFSNYHTVPLCGPSRACMFTGQFSTENGMWRGPGKDPLGSPGYRGIKRDVIMLSEHLSRQKIPRSIDYVDKIPRLPTGKLYKRILRDEYWGRGSNKIVKN